MNADYNIWQLIIMAALVSFLGFTVENTWLAITKGFIDNRNMNFPFLAGYGFFIIALYLLLGVPQDMSFAGHEIELSIRGIPLYFIISMILVTIGELALGYTVEKLCRIEYWNYLWIPMHITKYTSIPTSIGFAAIITFFMSEFFIPLMDFICQLNTNASIVLSVSLLIVMISDFVFSFAKMYKTHAHNLKWKLLIGRNGIEFEHMTTT